MVRRTTKAALTLAAGVSLVVALAGAAGASPKPTPSPSPPPAATSYSVTNLGSLGYGVTDGVAINATGQVTGRSFNGATITLKTCCGGCYKGGPHNPCKEHIYHAFVWSNGTMTDLGTLGGNFSAGNAINLSGEVVGSAQTSTGVSHVVLWDGGKITDLTTTALSGLSGASVAGINDSGQIVGTDSAVVVRSVILPPFHKTASETPVLVCAEPTTSPDRLIALPALKLPPKVPRSVIVPLLHTNAW